MHEVLTQRKEVQVKRSIRHSAWEHGKGKKVTRKEVLKYIEITINDKPIKLKRTTNLVFKKKSSSPLERMLIDSHDIINDLHAIYIAILLLQN